MNARPDLLAVIKRATNEAVEAKTPAHLAVIHGLAVGMRLLVDRIERLEETPPLKYMGTHESGGAYRTNELVTHQGSLWIALQDTKEAPGAGNGCWQLCAKRGRDGRNTR